jgi:transposase
VNKKYIVRLSEEERATLLGLIRVGNAAARKLMRARILLKVDQGEGGPGWTDEQTAEALEVGLCTIANVRQRFVEGGVEAAIRRKKQVRPSKLRKLDGAKEARLVAISCSEPPEGRAKWTMRLLADQLVVLDVIDSISAETVRRTLKKTSSSRT